MASTPGGPVPISNFLADLFIKVSLATGQVIELPFRNRRLGELIHKIPVDALFGMDMMSLGTFHVNGLTKNATFCW
jgi:hypothetical protein